ncbi:hypothetical protein CENSYa_1522 [Cenarchaeum symbiosum A]|uniref:Uncharacterized protein n=1 Tax=Cenarchaeum symbiosum (strain A) TaxID=414004 RepID=A0RXS7_CENSY|nr:hypothetical protein CENSYa_1522 [Cenarchaeum symbiosum A]
MSLRTKTVKGKEYHYFEYTEGGKHVQEYCGPAGSDRARARFLELEKEYLDRKKSELDERIKANKVGRKNLKSGGD